MNAKNMMLIVLVVLLAVVSVTILSPWASDPNTHRHTIEQTDEKIASVMKLSGGAAATSATLSLLPGDVCTPLAQELAELAKYFLLILSALYLEKFLITLSGMITFAFLVPLACFLFCLFIVSRKQGFRGAGIKILLAGLIVFLIVPASVLISDIVYQTQEAKVNETIENYDDLEIEGKSDGGLLSELSSITGDTIDRITTFTDNLLETLAVMIVTSCVIPLLVFAFLIWLVKTALSYNIYLPDPSVWNEIREKLG